jgi:hypothetical protein
MDGSADFRHEASRALDSGEIAIVARVLGQVDLGGTSFTADDREAVVFHLNGDGQYLRQQRFQGATGESVWLGAAAFAGDGDYALVVEPSNDIALPGGPSLTMLSFADVLVSYDAAGNYRGHQLLDGSYGYEMTIGPSGRIALTARSCGTLAFDGASHDFSINCGALVVLMNDDTTVVWTKEVFETTDGYIDMAAIALAANDDMYLAGSFEDALDLGGTVLTGGSDTDMFTARIDGSGTLVSNNSFGGAEDDWLSTMALYGSDDLLLFGSGSEGIDLGSGVLIDQGTVDFGWRTAANNGFVLALGDGNVVSTELDANAHAFISGSADAIDLGDGPFGGPGAFFAELDGSGTTLWRQTLVGGMYSTALHPSADGDAIVVGTYDGHLDVGTGALPAVGYGEDGLFVAKLATP